MKVIMVILFYMLAIVTSNLMVAEFGPVVTPVNAFLLIGFDLAARDWLQAHITTFKMGLLIAGAGLLTYLIAPGSAQIVLASSIAFTLSAVVDWLVFSRAKGSWLRRSNMSNTAGAAVDSVLFPSIAFGALMPWVVLAQFAAKTVGGALWAWLLTRKSA